MCVRDYVFVSFQVEKIGLGKDASNFVSEMQLYDQKANIMAGKDDDWIDGWIDSFIQDVGRDKVHDLLQRYLIEQCNGLRLSRQTKMSLVTRKVFLEFCIMIE